MADEVKLNIKDVASLRNNLEALAVTAKKSAKFAWEQVAASKEIVNGQIDAIRIGSKTLETLRAEKKGKEDLQKIGREYINTLREHGASQKQLNEISKKFGTSAKMNSDEFKNLLSSLGRGEISYKKFISQVGGLTGAFSGLIGVLGKLMGPFALLVGTLKLAGVEQASRRFSLDFEGMRGTPYNPKDLNPFAKGSRNIGKENTGYKLQAFGGAVGEDMLGYAKSMAKAGFITGKTSDSMEKLADVSMASMAMQKRFGAEGDNVNKIMHHMVYRMGIDTKSVGGALVNLADRTKGTALSVPEYFAAISGVMDVTGKYGKNLNSASKFIGAFSDELQAGTMSVGDFTSSFMSIRGASTGQMAGMVGLAERQGISFGATKPGMNMLEKVWAAREFSEKDPAGAVMKAMQIAIKTAPKGMGKTGQMEMMFSMFGGIIPGLENLRMLSTKNLNKMYDTAQSGGLPDKDLKQLMDDATNKSKNLENTTVTMAAATSEIANILKASSSAGAFLVINKDRAESEKNAIEKNVEAYKTYLNVGGQGLTKPGILDSAVGTVRNMLDVTTGASAGKRGPDILSQAMPGVADIPGNLSEDSTKLLKAINTHLNNLVNEFRNSTIIPTRGNR